MKRGVYLFILLITLIFLINFIVAEEFISPISASAISEYSSIYQVNNVYDGDVNTAWFTTIYPTFPVNLDLDFGKDVFLTGIDLHSFSTSNSYLPIVFNVYISSDNTNWELVLMNVSIDEGGQYSRFDFDSTVNLRYLRVEELNTSRIHNSKMIYGGAIAEVRGVLGDGDDNGVECVDSDGGINYYEKGYVDSTIGGHAEDNCPWESGASLNTSALAEWYCDNSTGSRAKVMYGCPSGCIDGACVGEEADSCQIDSDCPNEESELYCSEDTLCSTTTFYNCQNNQCVSWGGGGGCGICENGCSNSSGSSFCIEGEFEFRNLSTCNDLKEFIKNPYDFNFPFEYGDDLEWEFNSKDGYSGTRYINGESYDFDSFYSSFSYSREGFYANFRYEVMDYGNDISNEDLRDIFESNVHSGICSARSFGGSDGVYYFCDYSLWDFDDVGYDSEIREQGVVYWLSSTDNSEDNEFITSELVNGLVAYYNLDETSGTVVDSAGSFDGTNNGATRGVDGKIGDAFLFDGQDSFVDTLPVGDIPTTSTISLWIYPTHTKTQDSNQVFGSISSASGGKDGINLNYNKVDGHVSIGYVKGNIVQGVVISPKNFFPLNTWSHLTYTWDSSNGVRLYANGILIETGSFSSPPSSHDRALMFGKSILSQNLAFEGLMDEVGIWNRALSPDEVSDLYNNGNGLAYKTVNSEFITSELEDGLVTYYKFDGDITDSLGSNNLANSGTTSTSGKIGDARNFTSSSSQYAYMTTSTNIPVGGSARSINAWIYTTDTGNYRDILTYGTEAEGQWFHWRKNTNDKLWFQIQGQVAPVNFESNGSALSTSTWYMVSLTFDGTTWKMYQDGILVAEDEFITTNTGTTYKPYIGVYSNGLQEPWDGKIDEVGIWNRALSPDEVSDLYNNGNGLTYNTLPETNNIFSINVYYDYYTTNDNYETYEEYLLARINDKLDEVRGNQESSLDFLSKLKNNRGTSIDPMRFYYSMPGDLKNMLDSDLSICSSDLSSSEGECQSYWQCTLNPLVCPPHGEQKRSCVDFNGCFDKRETTQQCTPGICSGCSTPKWLGRGWNELETKCMPYGVRFEYTTLLNGRTETLPVDVSDNKLIFDLDVIDDRHAVYTITVKEYNLSSTYDLREGDFVMFDILELIGQELPEVYIDKITYDSSMPGNGEVLFTMPTESNAYCDYDGNIKTQKTKDKLSGEWASCQNNFECDSNLCSSGECIEVVDLIVQAKGMKKIGIQVLCRLADIFGIQGYEQCILENLGE